MVVRKRPAWAGLLWLLAACDDGSEPLEQDIDMTGREDASARDAQVGADAARVHPLDAGPDGQLVDAARDAPSSDASVAASADASSARVDGSSALSLRVLTYNVAGLPEPLSSAAPARNSPLISPLLNDYDLVFLQEDFAYHAQIVGAATHPYRTLPDSRGKSLGDGLSLLSSAPFGELTRQAWRRCHGLLDSGSDCLTPKGFAFTRLTVGAFELDLYDLHADAGSSPADQAARADNLLQLAMAIEAQSAGRAVIVAGDFNARYTRAGDSLAELLDSTQLQDVWLELERAGERPEPGTIVSCSTVDLDDPACERIDKVLYRSGKGLHLTPHAYRVEGARFVDATGAQLSDHRPVSAMFTLSAP